MDNESKKADQNILHNLLEFGIINIDKPSGPTSFDVSDFVRKKLNLRKTSHFGTLDPKVTGVLPIALNRACKLTGFFLGEDKEYVGIMRIHEEIKLEDLRKKIKEKFTGKIKQIPPVKSRVKRQEREREIKKFEILEQGNDKKDFLFEVECEGGTYIRKLIDDLGKALGTGAHMLELRRARAGIFSEDGNKKCMNSSVNMYEFEKAAKEYGDGKFGSLKKIIIPAEEAIKQIFESVKIKEESVKKLLTGKPLSKKDMEKFESERKMTEREKFAVFFNDKFIGIYKKVNEGEIIARPEFVLQEISDGR